MTTTRPILVPIPEQFVGAHVLLRRLNEDDVDTLYTLLREAQPHLARWLPGFEAPPTAEDALEGIRRLHAHWARRESFSMGIFARADGALVGDVRLRPGDWKIPAFDLAYWLHPAAEGHGYARAAVRLLTAFAFENLHARRVMIACDKRNVRSRRVPESLGFPYEGCLRNHTLGADGQPFDMMIYAMTPADYTQARAAWPTEC
jgi:RimJ/RimL family protein N-acetyltransferase